MRKDVGLMIEELSLFIGKGSLLSTERCSNVRVSHMKDRVTSNIEALNYPQV